MLVTIVHAVMSIDVGYGSTLQINSFYSADQENENQGIWLLWLPGFDGLNYAVQSSGRGARKRQYSSCVSLEIAALNELVAQLVEQRPFKAWVVRSNRTELTIQNKSLSLLMMETVNGRCDTKVIHAHPARKFSRL